MGAVHPLLSKAKTVAERITGARIYRNSIPRGTNLFFDLDRRFGLQHFQTVFDVGANVGHVAAEYAREFPNADIYSFEPVRSTFLELESRTRSLPRVHAFNLAMGSAAGFDEIYASMHSTASSFVLSKPGDVAEKVHVDTIATFVAHHSLQSIDFLKTDTEGFELEVLAGAVPLLQEQKISMILSECEPVARTDFFVTLASLGQFLRRFGYELFGLYEQQPEWDGTNVIKYCNALFVCRNLVPSNAQMPTWRPRPAS